jgi:hypothetical protein
LEQVRTSYLTVREDHAGDTGSAGALSVFICNDNIPTAQSFADGNRSCDSSDYSGGSCLVMRRVDINSNNSAIFTRV